MYFKRIELHGFKSFAEPTVIEFDRGITCVVGPNGSGKSNICDAIRWVLGAQSAKALRGDKMEDVIFSGTSSRKSRGMAEVTLVIDNEDGALPIDYNEVAITRRMYRSGESEYLINNNRCRMRDIRELIMDTGIGVEGYSIIGQGKISDIISNNTESIREILEETAGIVMYRTRKAEAERKLKSATDNMDRVNDIIGEQEARLPGLKEDSEKATEYLALRERHQELEINITLRNIENIQEKSSEIAKDLENLEKSIDEAAVKRETVNVRLGKSGENRESLDVRIDEKHQEEMRLSEEINRLVNRRQVDQERLRALAENEARLTDEIADLAERMAREEENAKALAVQQEEAAAGVAEMRKALDAAVNVYTEKNGKAAAMMADIDEKKNLIFALQNQISSYEAEIASIDNLKETLERRRETLLSQGTSDEESSRDAKASLEELTAQKEARARRLMDEEKTLVSAKDERQEQLAAQKAHHARIADLSVLAGEQESRKKTLEEMESSYEGYQGAVRFIMQAGQAGLHGVVADIINVPSGMETAMETALGGALQNIVCEDDDAAKAAIRKLKEERAGRLTFLPLASMNARGPIKDAALERADGFVSYGVDAVTYDDKYRTVMEYLLGNVVVMENMDKAVAAGKIMDSTAKLVTLDGEIINAAGAITGGRGKHKSANILERKGEIAQLEAAIRENRAQLAKEQEALANLESAMDRTAAKITDLEQQVAKTRMEQYAKDAEMTLLEGSLKDLASGEERRRQELANIATEEESSRNMVAKRREEIEEGKEQQRILEQQIETAQSEYEIMRDAVRAESEAITEARIKVTAKENEQDKIEALAKQLKDTVAQWRMEKEAKEQQLKAQREEMAGLKEAAGDGEGDPIGDAKAAKEAVANALATLRTEKQDLLAKIEEDTAARERLDGELASLQNQKYELQVRNARQETQLENAKNKLWEEFEVSLLQAMELRNEDFIMSRAVAENRQIKSRLRELGEVNVGAIEEYAQVKERYDFLIGQREDIETSMNELNGIIRDMDKVIRTKFKASFDQVVVNFEEVFRDLYGGGHANIVMTDKEDLFDSEIEISAQPPGKQLKHINLMSGGEKTMTAIALMFAVLKTKPTPCCILDEIEAALDDSNLQIFGQYIKRFTGVQFTLITHQKATMEHADVMYGITMPESGVSKVYSLKLDDPEEPVADAG